MKQSVFSSRQYSPHPQMSLFLMPKPITQLSDHLHAHREALQAQQHLAVNIKSSS